MNQTFNQKLHVFVTDHLSRKTSIILYHKSKREVLQLLSIWIETECNTQGPFEMKTLSLGPSNIITLRLSNTINDRKSDSIADIESIFVMADISRFILLDHDVRLYYLDKVFGNHIKITSISKGLYLDLDTNVHGDKFHTVTLPPNEYLILRNNILFINGDPLILQHDLSISSHEFMDALGDISQMNVFFHPESLDSAIDNIIHQQVFDDCKANYKKLFKVVKTLKVTTDLWVVVTLLIESVSLSFIMFFLQSMDNGLTYKTLLATFITILFIVSLIRLIVQRKHCFIIISKIIIKFKFVPLVDHEVMVDMLREMKVKSVRRRVKVNDNHLLTMTARLDKNLEILDKFIKSHIPGGVTHHILHS